jgi:hypothetical protein
MSRELVRALERVAERFRGLRLWTGLAACWLAFALAGWGLAGLLARARPEDGWVPVPALLGWFLTLAIAGAAVVVLTRRSVRDLRWVARRIEARFPELGTGLLAAVEDTSQEGPRGYLRDVVLRQALTHRAGHDWGAVVSPRSLAAARVGHIVALVLLATATLALGSHVRSKTLGFPPPERAGIVTDVEVDPGDAAIEKGTSLLVVARFPIDAVPAEAALDVDDGASSRPMTRSLEDPTFAGRIEAVADDVTYRVAFGGRATRDFRVTVFEYPEVRRTDALLAFPSYTGMENRLVQDVRHVTAVEGTELTLTCRLNKEVVEAALVDEAGRALPLKPANGEGPSYAATLTLAESHRYKVRLVDRDGRSSKVPAEVAVNVTKNRPATVAMARPGRDTRVSPLEELSLQAKLADDFGVVRHGVTYTLAEREPAEVVLATNGPGAKAIEASHMLAFESLKAQPDQLVTYFIWAEDIGPDGKRRRTSGDMFFAEVRHFEEIFRQGEGDPSGQQPGQQGGGNAREAEQLAELQKQVINATWTLIRRETGGKPAPTLADDAKAVEDAQRTAIEQAEALDEKLNDPRSREFLDRATTAMNEAARRLAEAGRGPSAAPLTPALASAQTAYQALLKLRAREFEVTRRNQRQQNQGGGGGGAQRQAQLDELELTNDENRYEQRSSARSGSQQQQEQRETRHVLNRLAELARRQSDLNDRLKELQSALEAAKEPQVREEIERQLKRLREQEQQILRDADELRERMEREENRERMAEARQALEQSRERLRRASEALEDSQVGQAIIEGARAGRELNDLREDLRKSSSDRFGEDLAEMREQARRLDERQGELTRQLESQDRPDTRRSLRDEGKEQVRQGLREQAQQLDDLMERMRRTVQEAEETEPLLARSLFDTAKKAAEQSIPNALKDAERLADAGFSREAAESSRQAGRGIEQVREGVEKAARSVLGDEEAALQRARDELEDLTRQVEREVARAGGQGPSNDPSDAHGVAPRSGQPGDRGGPGREGQQAAQDQQPGEPGREGQRPGQRGESQQPGQDDQRPGQGQQGRPYQQPGQRGEGQQPGQGSQPGEGDQQPGQGQQGQQSGQGQRPEQGQQSGQGQAGQPNGQGGNRQGDNARGGPGGLERLLDGLDNNAGGPGGAPGGPITGDGFREWTDRMRDVEDLLQDPQLRSEAARIRDRVRGAREEFKRHSKVPDPAQLKTMIADPIHELRDRVAEELRRRESPDSLVPIDRDPVPPRYAEGVRRYYERLGSGR